MKLLNSAQMREIDRHIIEETGVSGAELMSKASGHLAEAVIELLPEKGRCAIICGTGNNGGDGIGSAAVLLEKGYDVRVYVLGDARRFSEDSQKMLSRLQSRGGGLLPFEPSAESFIINCDVIIDAIFGIGLNKDLTGVWKKAVEIINESSARVVSADIPSGVNADTGEVMGAAVSADVTVAFTAAKPGHFTKPGCFYIGELRVRDIGIPRDIISGCVSDVYAVMAEDVSMPPRALDAHKGNFGKCFIVAGSRGYTGAPVLSAKAASRMGAGLVYIGVPESIYTITAVKCDEEMPFPLADDGDGKLSSAALEGILAKTEISDVLICGMGLGKSRAISETIGEIIKTVKKPLVLDADGINAVAENIDVLDEAACPLILTPHEGEFARISGSLSSCDRLTAAREFSKRYGCILVLKGYRTITAFPTGEAYINTTGGPAMAKGGSGDVLAGIIGALIGQKFPIKDAVITAVYLHGLAGDISCEKLGEYSVTAGSFIDSLPYAIRAIYKGASFRLGGNHRKYE